MLTFPHNHFKVLGGDRDHLLDLPDDLRVVGRPGERKSLREVRLTEEPEGARRPLPALRAHDLWQRGVRDRLRVFASC